MKGFKVIIISLELWQKGKMRLSSAVFYNRLKFRVFLGVAALEIPCPVLSCLEDFGASMQDRIFLGPLTRQMGKRRLALMARLKLHPECSPENPKKLKQHFEMILKQSQFGHLEF